MKSRLAKFVVLTSLMMFLFASCASPAANPQVVTDMPASTNSPQEKSTNAVPPTAIPSASGDFTPSADDIAINPDKNTLIIASGYGRILRNGAKDWTAVVSGEWLENGDQIQLTEDSNAMIWLKDGSLIRFLGLTDFRLNEADKDPITGRVHVAGQLLNGMLMARITPLPTSDSVFQIYFFTNLFSVEYSESARAYFEKEKDGDESAIYILGALGEEEDTFWQIQGNSRFYDVQKSGENYYAVEYLSSTDSSTEIAIPVIEDENIEEEIQSMLPDIGMAISLRGSSISTSQDFNPAFKVVAEGNLADGNKQRVLGLSIFGSANPPIPSGVKSVQMEKFGMSLPQLIYVPSGDESGKPASPGMNRMILSPASFAIPNFAQIFITRICYPQYGFGCKYPAGCDKKTGSGCALSTGCNPVTKNGCVKGPLYCQVRYTFGMVNTNCAPTFPQYTLKCKANQKGDCDKFYDPAKFKQFESENCCVCNPPNTKRLPNWVYFHYDVCSAPGAKPAGTCGPSTCK